MNSDRVAEANVCPPVADLQQILADRAAGEPFHRLARLAAAALKAPAALLALVTDAQTHCKGAAGLPESVLAPGGLSLPSPYMQQLVGSGAPLAVGDAAGEQFGRDPLVAATGAVALLGIPLGAPLRPLPAGLVVLDTRPRTWEPAEVQLLREVGESVLTELEAIRLQHPQTTHAAALLDGVPLGLFLLDPQGRLALLNPEAARFFRRVSGQGPEQLLGKDIWHECPEVADSAFAKECRRAEAEVRPFQLETYFPGLRRWFAFHGTRSPEGLCIAFEDVTDRTHLQQQLHARAEELAESARGKEVFLAKLAHELRNSLGPVRNALHLWDVRDSGAEAGQARALAEREVRHITRLLNDLLKVVQLAPDTPPAPFEPLDLVDVVANALRTVLASPEGRGQRLLVDLPSEPLPVDANAGMLEQVVVHLLANAAKFSRPGGQSWLELCREDGEAVLRVRDTGVGIAPEALPHVFDLFMRADRTPGRLRDGLGVGLTLVRRIVKLHGGEVSAQSEGPDQGSEFAIRLPLRTEDPPAPTTARGLDGQSCQILVVDNSKEAAQSIALLLSTWGYESRVSYDPLSALEEVRAEPPAAVLLDIGMPGMDGYEVARRLRSEPPSQDLVLVAVTGYGEEEDRQRARAAGFDYHMTKPVDPTDLRSLLEMAGLRPRGVAPFPSA